MLAVAARDAARCRWSRLHEYLQSLHSAIRALFEPRELQPEFPLAHVRRVELYTSRRPRFPAKFIESPPRDRACCSGGRRTATGLFSASNVAMESPPKLSRFFRAFAAPTRPVCARVCGGRGIVKIGSLQGCRRRWQGSLDLRSGSRGGVLNTLDRSEYFFGGVSSHRSRSPPIPRRPFAWLTMKFVLKAETGARSLSIRKAEVTRNGCAALGRLPFWGRT